MTQKIFLIRTKIDRFSCSIFRARDNLSEETDDCTCDKYGKTRKSLSIHINMLNGLWTWDMGHEDTNVSGFLIAWRSFSRYSNYPSRFPPVWIHEYQLVSDNTYLGRKSRLLRTKSTVCCGIFLMLINISEVVWRKLENSEFQLYLSFDLDGICRDLKIKPIWHWNI